MVIYVHRPFLKYFVRILVFLLVKLLKLELVLAAVCVRAKFVAHALGH
jgi:hypothetical protein